MTCSMAYNDLAYGTTKVYDASAPEFRERLFNWEAELVQRVFPPPPGRVLVGGAGGGRETFELISRGYAVAAFEPSDVLARSMADRAATNGHAVEVFLGRYQELPVLRRGWERSGRGSAGSGNRFDAAMLGWSSFSHIRHRQDRISTLQRFAEVTDGPVVASFFLRRDTNRPRHRLSRWAGRFGLRADGDRVHPAHRVLSPELGRRAGGRSCGSRPRPGRSLLQRHGWLLALDCGRAPRCGVGHVVRRST